MKFTINTPLAIHELGKRQNQEDAIYPVIGNATADDRLFLVCDGMGGHESGEVASNTVCQAMSKFINENANGDTFSDALLKQAIDYAYNALDEANIGHDSVKTMGTTMTLLKLHEGGCTIAHMGDSRIYHIRPAEHYIWHTRDHSLVNDMYEIGEIKLEDMKNYPQKNVITRAMQPGQERRSKAAVKLITDIKAGDFFFLCSDGMLEETEDENLLNIFSDSDTTDEEKREILVKVTEDNRDNHSAYIIHVTGVTEDTKENDTPCTTQEESTEEEPNERFVAPQPVDNTAEVIRQAKQPAEKKVEATATQAQQPAKHSLICHIDKKMRYVLFLALVALAVFCISMIIIYFVRLK